MDNAKDAFKRLSENLAIAVSDAKIPADEFYLYKVIDALQSAIHSTIEELDD